MTDEIESDEKTSSSCSDSAVAPLPQLNTDVDVENLSQKIAQKKLDIHARLANRRLALEEKRLDHCIAMENRIEDFKETEALRLNKFMDSRQTENWMVRYWRPVMGWIYALICLFDFVIAPTVTIILTAITKTNIPEWKSLTLENGGLIHLAFAAILGVTAWTRGQENIIKTKMTSMPMSNGNGSSQSSKLEL